MNEMSTRMLSGFDALWAATILYVPKIVAFVAIIAVGYFVAKWLGRLLDKVLERLHFDEMVERGGVRKALSRCGYDPSDILGKILFYTVFLFVLQMAFGVFGPNPVSTLLTGLIAFLPNIFVAILIVIVASGIGIAVREIVKATLGGLSYGRFLAAAAAVAIISIGAFAALNQLGIAPEIVNGLFYAVLFALTGSAVIAIGGGGIVPMRRVWERALGKIEAEAPIIREEASKGRREVAAKVEEWKAKDRLGAGTYKEVRRSEDKPE